MFHQKIKQCFSHSVHLVSSVISEFTYSDTDLTRNRKFPADKLITFLVSKAPPAQKMNCWTSSTWIHSRQLLQHSTSNAQSLARMPWKLYFGILTILLPFMTKKSYATAFLLQMAPPLPFSVNLLSPQKSIMSLMDIQ